MMIIPTKLSVIIKRYKTVLLYFFFGGLTFLISVVSFELFVAVLKMHELAANTVSWVIAVAFAYFTNRIWVFDGKTNSKAELFRQALSFFGGRLGTLALEELILYAFITRLGYNQLVIKIIAQIIVIVTNYYISKCLVFKKTK